MLTGRGRPSAVTTNLDRVGGPASAANANTAGADHAPLTRRTYVVTALADGSTQGSVVSNSRRGLIGVRCGYLLLLGYRPVSVAVLIPDVTPLTNGEAVHHVLGRGRGGSSVHAHCLQQHRSISTLAAPTVDLSHVGRGLDTGVRSRG